MLTSLSMRGRFVAVLSAALVGVAGLTGCDTDERASQAVITPAVMHAQSAQVQAASTQAAPAEERIRPTAQNAQEQAVERARQTARTNAERVGVVFSDDPNAQPRMLWRSEQTQHAGKVYSRDMLTFEFEFYNGGTGPLRISRINASCGCTAFDKDKFIDRDYMPGEGDTILVKYTPRNDGNSSKLVTIFSNDATTPVTRLRIGADVVPIGVVEPANIQPGTLLTNKTHVLTFHVKSEDPYAKITGFKANIPSLKGVTNDREITFKAQPAVELVDDPKHAVSIPVRMTIPAGLFPNGKASVDIEVAMTGTPPGAAEPMAGSANARMIANFAGELRVTSRFARISETRPGMPYTISTNVTTLSAKEFQIEKVEVTDANGRQIDVTYEIEPVKDAASPTYALTISGTTPESVGAMRGTVSITSNLKGEGPVQMVFNGFIRNPETAKEAAARKEEARRVQEKKNSGAQ